MSSEQVLSVASPAQPTPSASIPQSIVTLKSKKAIFKQQPLGLDQALSTISERLNFHTYLQTISEPLKEFPVAHLPLIAKLVHESEETYHHAANRIHKLLAAQVPSAGTNGMTAELLLPKAVIDAAVRRVSDRTNWGVENGVSGATIWRLEVKDRSMLPPEFQDVCEARWKERNQAKLEIQVALSNMSEADRAQYVKSTSTNGTAAATTSTDKDVIMASPTKEDKDSAKKSATRAKKQADETPQNKERLEKKVAKAEKDKKSAEGVKKSAAAFASFFTSTRPAVARVKTGDVTLSDYDQTFHPFIVKKNTVRAPVNRFIDSRAQLPATGSSSSNDLLREFLDSAPAKLRSGVSHPTRPSQHLEVRAVINELNEAEVVGDSKAVRRLTALLKNRRAFPAKLFHFHENNKPAYYGTWTKTSQNIRARRPFGKDESLDYDYDSDDDWEEEGEGEAIVSDGSDEEDSDSADEEEGWLVDDDDDEVEEVPAEGTEGTISDSAAKRKAEASAKNKDSKRRKVEKLVPFQKGPCWEAEIGECSYEPFNAYRIQLLNDCPYPVDPFTFIPEPVSSVASGLASGPSATQPPGVFATPTLPTATNDIEVPGALGASSKATTIKKPVDPTNIKNPFPTTHLPELYSLIEGSEKTLKGLVEDLYLALKKHPGVKKYAIEAKLREVADKNRSVDAPHKRWRVSDEAWTAIGMTRPG
ncbi:chromatin assembly factor 1 subunit A [Ceratobasidium sp. AG-Ba]|nr:chromatin assembly factor 1 subunit A [Ceratobasidium sp. AG-Ba]